MTKHLIVGGVSGGASVAARLRRLDESAEVIMFERGPNVSFSNCALPFHLSRKVPVADSLVLMNPEVFRTQYNIEARVNSEVLKINPEAHTVLVKNLETGEEYEESYDKLFISPGANAIMPRSIKGIDRDNVFSVRNVVDIKKIANYVEEHNVENVAVIGGGFIGMEVMENLKEYGKNVTLVEALDQVVAPVDYDMAQIIHKEMKDHGVGLELSDGISAVEDGKIVLASGKEVAADMVVMCIGVRPEVGLCADAGIELGVTGGIKTDPQFRTNVKDIYAVGDAIETFNSITRKAGRLTLAGPSQRQARAAADDAYGRTVSNKGFIGSSCLQVFDLNVASTGLTVKECEKNGLQYDYVYLIPGDKVGLMPTSNPMHFKLVFEVPTGKILGAQAIGKGNTDKRVDVIATMITMGGTLEDLKELELCYSPMYGTAKDVVNHAALNALNVLNGEFKQVKVSDVRGLVESGATIFDVREPHEYAAGHLTTSKNLPMSEFRSRLDEIPTDEPVYVHCRSAQRSYNVTRALNQLGFDNVVNISGSFMGICYYEYYNDVTLGRTPIVTEYNFK